MLLLRIAVANFAGARKLSKIYILPPNNECAILIKGETLHIITGFNIVNKQRIYTYSACLHNAYIYRVKDPYVVHPEFISAVSKDICLARKLCEKKLWWEVQELSEAHPFHGLFWSPRQLYGVPNFIHRPSKSVAKVLERKAVTSNKLLRTFKIGQDILNCDLYDSLFNFLNYLNHPQYKDDQLAHVFELLELENTSPEGTPVIVALVHEILLKIVQVRPTI